MQRILTVYKPIGLTPLQLINKLKEEQPHIKNEKITYAGRLDPLAHGVMLLLIGEEAKNRDQYLNLPKEYEFEVVFGLETDTYDMLGLVKSTHTMQEATNVNIIVNTFVNNHIGVREQKYPPFSSKAVEGKPLFWWAKQKKLHEITIPTRQIEIYDFHNTAISVISAEKLKKHITETITHINGDFRQKEILERWEQYFSSQQGQKQREYQTAKFKISCSSGTYVRSLAHALGKEMGTGAIALEILRTKVGEYTMKDALILAKS